MAHGNTGGRYKKSAEQDRLRQRAFQHAVSHSRRVRWLKISLPLIVVAAVLAWGVIAVFNPFRHLPAGVSASGYHLDGNGNCQPNSGYTNTGCPPGFMSEPFPNWQGFRCVPIPASYSQYFH